MDELKSDVDKFLPKKVASTIIKTECFFHLSGFFVTLNGLSYKDKWENLASLTDNLL